MFQGLRANAPIYIIDKSGDMPKLKIGIVEKVSDPYSRFGTTTMPMMGQPLDAVVDVTIKIDDGSVEMKKLPAMQSIISPDGNPKVIVSDSREAAFAEVENIERISQGIVDGYDLNKNIVDACADMKRALNPQLAKEHERDEEIVGLKARIVGMEQSLGNIEALLRDMNNGVKTKRNESN